MWEWEAVLNPHPLRVDTVSDVNSPAPLVPANIFCHEVKGNFSTT